MAGTNTQANRRQVLIVDDDPINRDLLGFIVQTNYDVLYAENGREALALLQRFSRQISLVLLDLLMPVMDGKTLMAHMRADEELHQIPIIVLTSELDAEVECLEQGASDFIKKPYDMPEVIMARINRTVELAEDRRIIGTVEVDELSGLYSKAVFFEYASMLELRCPGVKMDAVVVDLDHFHLLNETHGRAFGDRVLRTLGEEIQAVLKDTIGIACRCEADTFFIYCAHREDHQQLLDRLSAAVSGFGEGLIHVRMGVCSRSDMVRDIIARFDRARAACNKVRGNFLQALSFYDETLYSRDIHAQRLVSDMTRAVAEGQFTVYYQPKYDVTGEEPVLQSAEALVRWRHPELGMISPGEFIPLFERNGMIHELDRYVWRQSARQIMDWQAKFGRLIPVSVNVSRVDLYDAGLLHKLNGIRSEFSLPENALLLEITESAYTSNLDQALDAIQALRAAGYRIEMDDFGSGYSSLNMLLRMPIDVLKVDGAFMRAVSKRQSDTWLIHSLVEIARHLGVPIVFEGVEEAEQVELIRRAGGNIIQGYYFSRPLPANEFEKLLTGRRDTKC